jgi:hypothetical protein
MKKNYFLNFIICLFISIPILAQVNVGDGTNVDENLPIEPYFGYTYSQSIYNSALISASGSITGIKYFATPGTTLANSSEWVVYIGVTENDEFLSTDSWIPLTELTQVYSATTSISDGVVSLTFDSPFEYDGNSNLVIAVEENQASYDYSTHDFYCTPADTSVSLVFYSDSTNPDPTWPPNGSFRNFLPNIVLEGITQSCSTPSITLDLLTATTASFSWTAADVDTFEYALQEAGNENPESGTLISDNSIEFSELIQGQDYEFFLRSVCEDQTTDWFSFTFTPPPAGSTADDPIIIESIPYSTSDDTINYGDDYTNGATGCQGSGSYLGGDDVVYLYTPDSDASLNVKFTPQGSWNGIYVYENAEDIGVNCWLVNYVNIDPEQTVFDLTVYAGQSYYFVISSYPSPQNIAYSLDISENSCVPPVYTAEVVANCSGGEGDYSVDFDVSEIGSFNDFNLSDGTSTISVQEAGIYTFGPYNSGDSVSFTVETGDVNCDSSVDFTYTCPPTGAACVDPLLIDSLPYNTSDDTANYGDNYDGSVGASAGCGTSGTYLNGDDVVYSYTSSIDGIISVLFAPTDNYAGIFMYDSCDSIGVECLAGGANGFNSDIITFEADVITGSTYYFVVSTWASPQSTTYDLVISELLCASPTDFVVSDVTSSSASVSWAQGDAVSWEYVFSEGGSSLPSDAGEPLTEPTVSVESLESLTSYDVWVRGVCADGTFSDYVLTSFTTLLAAPGCGETLTYDYPNASSGGSLFDDNFDLTSNDYSSDLLFTTSAGDDDGDGVTDAVTVTLGGSTESNYDWVFITDGAGNLLYGPVSGPQSGSYTSADGTVNVYLAADTSVQGGPVTFEIGCALSVSDNEISDLRIYPNPVDTDYVTIVSSLVGDKFIEMFDINGRRVLSTSISGDKLDISSLESGFYMTRVTIDGKSSNSKLIIN